MPAAWPDVTPDSSKTSAASGTVSANQYVGGLVGRLEGGGIQRSLFTGLVTNGGGYVGGIAGYVAPAVAPLSNNLYWDVQTSGTSAAAGYDVNGVVQASGLTTANLQNGTLPSGLASHDLGRRRGPVSVSEEFLSDRPAGPVRHGLFRRWFDGLGRFLDRPHRQRREPRLGVERRQRLLFRIGARRVEHRREPAHLFECELRHAGDRQWCGGARRRQSLRPGRIRPPRRQRCWSTTKTAVATAAGGNAAAIAAINGASLYNITATGASFTVDQTISRAASPRAPRRRARRLSSPTRSPSRTAAA